MAPRILLVEDEAVSLRLAQRMLEGAGYAVDTAEDGEAAAACFANASYDVVLLDLYMPRMDGFGLLAWLKERNIEPVCIVFSASGEQEDVVRAMRHGAFDYIAKPIADGEVLLAQVQRALEHKRLHDENLELLHAVQEKNRELETRIGQLSVAHGILRSQALAVQANLRRAQAIQEGLLPAELPFWKQVSLAAYFRPAARVGGDFFDVFRLDSRRIGIYVADNRRARHRRRAVDRLSQVRRRSLGRRTRRLFAGPCAARAE